MKRIFIIVLFLFSVSVLNARTVLNGRELPETVFVEQPDAGHIQGFAVDLEKGYMYMSFTTVFLKTDMQGKVLATIKDIPGHLGAMAFNPLDRKVYSSLEIKDDALGRSVAGMVKRKVVNDGGSVFYVAIIDVDRMDSLDMDAEKDGIFSTVCIHDACNDYAATVDVDGNRLSHRYGCSGIDGITFAPKIGSRSDKLYLYVSYGVYRDDKRTDNDNQIICRYDVSSLKKYARPVNYENLHRSGPSKPLDKYFLYTGNTDWGIQNLAYDSWQRRIYLAAYPGFKEAYPNYTLFAIDVDSRPTRGEAVGIPGEKHVLLKTAEDGLGGNGVGRGWFFEWGSTGMCSLGDSYWYFSEHGKRNGVHNSTIRLYRWTGDAGQPFKPVKE